jgi:hypothetical protein
LGRDWSTQKQKGISGHPRVTDGDLNVLRKLACPKSALDFVFPNGRGRIESHANITNRGFYAIQRKVGMLVPDPVEKFAPAGLASSSSGEGKR